MLRLTYLLDLWKFIFNILPERYIIKLPVQRNHLIYIGIYDVLFSSFVKCNKWETEFGMKI